MSFMSGFDSKIAALKEKYSIKCNIPPLKINGKTVETAIVQGGMGVGISLSGLASAVADQGGVGVIAANAIGMIESDYYENHIEANIRALKNEIRKAKKVKERTIGVNIMVAVDCFSELLNTAIEEKVDILFLGAGLPIKNIPVEKIREVNIAVVPIVSSGRAARLIFKSWEKLYGDLPDGVVVEGPKAGGHLGFKYERIDHPDSQLETIVPEVVEVLSEFRNRYDRDIPVIAAGGIFSGEDIYRIMKLGAEGVQMGTRFVATHECDADRRFKDVYVNAQEKDVKIINSPVGLPGRAVNNRFLQDIEAGVKKHFQCPSKCLDSCKAKDARYCISEALDNARKGEFENGFAFAGSNVFKVNSVVSVKELFSDIKFEYAKTVVKEYLRGEYQNVSEKLSKIKSEYSDALSKVAFEMQESIRKTTLENEIKMKQKMENVTEVIIKLKEEYNIYLNKISQISEDLSLVNGELVN